MTLRSLALLLRIDSSSLIVSWSSFSSSRSFLPSSWVSRRSCMSRMKLAWISEKPNGFFISPARATSTSAALRMSSMTLSIMPSAFTRPSTMCSRSLARRRRYSVRRVTTSIWCATYTRIAWSSVSTRGTPSTSASMLAEKLVCIGVCL